MYGRARCGTAPHHPSHLAGAHFIINVDWISLAETDENGPLDKLWRRPQNKLLRQQKISTCFAGRHNNTKLYKFVIFHPRRHAFFSVLPSSFQSRSACHSAQQIGTIGNRIKPLEYEQEILQTKSHVFWVELSLSTPISKPPAVSQKPEHLPLAESSYIFWLANSPVLTQ